MGTLVFQATLGGAVNIIGPNIANTINFTLPSADGTSGQTWTTNGSGVLAFGTLGIAGGGTGQITATAAFNALAPSQSGQSGKYLTTDGTNTSWGTNPLGTVTSVAATVPSFLSIAGSPITTSGTLAFSLSGTALPTTSGGTGLTSFTSGGVVYASSTSALTTGSVLVFDGTNLGVGGSSAGAKLSVNKGASGAILRLTDGTQQSMDISSNAGASSSGTITSDTLNGGAQAWAIASSEGMRLTSTGLGIGTSSVSQKLTVNGTSGSFGGVAAVAGFNTGTTGDGIIGVGSSDGRLDFGFQGGLGWIATGGNYGIRFLTNSGERLRIDSAGNVGIGTSSPASRLDVSYGGFAGSQGAIAMGADVGANTSRTNATRKFGVFSGVNYTNAEENINLIYYDSDGTNNYIGYGGGPSGFNAATIQQWFTAATPTTTAGTERMRLDSAGNFIVGGTSPFASDTGRGNISINGASTSILGLGVNNSMVGYLFHDGTNMNLFNDKNGYLRFATNGSERARIDASGNLLVGTTNSSNSAGTGIKFSANGLAASVIADSGTAADTWNIYNTTAGAFRFYVTNGGTIFATSTTISAISDERLKENIQDIDTGLDAIMALKPRRFDWKEGKGQDKKNAAGFIAQEFGEIFPASVTTGKAGGDGIEYLNMSHEELIPSLVKAMQEQQALIVSLKARLDAANL